MEQMRRMTLEFREEGIGQQKLLFSYLIELGMGKGAENRTDVHKNMLSRNEMMIQKQGI